MENGQYYGAPGFQGIPQGGMPGMMGTGFQFQGVQPQNVPQIKNNLTQEEIQKLIQKDNQFSLVVTETEKLRAICNHKWPEPKNNSWDAIVELPDGTCQCAICGYQFEPIDMSTTEETLKETVKDVLDILQTTKMLYVDMPVDVAREFYVIIPLIEKLPKLFEQACKSYMKYDGGQNPYGYNNRNMNTMNMFNMLASVLQGQAPMPAQQPQTGFPNGGVAPMGAYAMPGQFGMPAYGMSNGFVAQPGYVPQAQGFQYTPGQPQAAPAAAAAPQATTDGQTVTVDQKFKA